MGKHNLEREPHLFRERVPDRLEGESLVLGLDLGTTTGVCWTYHRRGHAVDPAALTFHLAQWDLSAGSYDSGSIRFVRLRQFLYALRPDAVFYERVRNTPSETPTLRTITSIIARAATAAELFGAFMSTVGSWCEEAGIPCEGLGIADLKRRATGKGNASKDDMIAACNQLFGAGLDPVGYESSGVDNIADAAYCCLLGLERYAQGLVPSKEAPRV